MEIEKDWQCHMAHYKADIGKVVQNNKKKISKYKMFLCLCVSSGNSDTLLVYQISLAKENFKVEIKNFKAVTTK